MMIRHDPQKAAYEQGCKDTIERIADELERIADSYIDGAFSEDIWSWTGKLAKKVRAGGLTYPQPTEPPF